MNIIDKFFEVVSPEIALRRSRARVMSELINENARSYNAASKSKRTSGWRTSATSASAEVSVAKALVRDRMRDLVRNDPYAKQAVRRIVGNVIGSGIRPKFTIDNKKEEKQFKSSWKDWAESKACDFDDRVNFFGLQKLFMRTVCESGSAIVIKRRTGNKANPLQIQILEPDHIDYTKNSLSSPGEGYVIDGIEFDKNGKRVAYWLLPQHPGNSVSIGVANTLTSKRFTTDECFHAFHVERPGQIDGMPLGVSGMLKLKDFGDYEDAQLKKQQIAACFAVFVKQDSGSFLAGNNQAEKEINLLSNVSPATIEVLPPGKDITFATPPVTEGYAEYTQTVLRGVAAGFGITYEQLTNDLSNVNFSSGRMGWIESSKWFSELQNDIVISQFCEGVMGWFTQIQGIYGVKSKVDCAWTSPRREFIDPSKETEATIGSMRGGLKSFGDMAMENGRDPDELMEDIAKWTEIAKSKGLELEFDPRYENKLNATDSRKF